MDDQNNDQSSENSDDYNEIINDFFGIYDEENETENCPTRSDCEDELQNMDTNDEATFNNDTSCEKTTDDASCNQLSNNHTEIAESPCFGSHIFDLKSKESNAADMPSSFAKITKDYEKSMKDMSTHVADTSENNCQASQLEPKSTVVISPKTNLQSLSMISNNYQDSSSESDESSDNDDDDEQCANSDDNLSMGSVSSNLISKESVKTIGELDITDLPPIEDLKISVDEEQCKPIGCVKSFVDTLVVVEAFCNQPALDIDSILFLDRGKRALGKIFDVFGPVNKPFYAVRFNNSDHIKNFNVAVKEPVFCAPNTEYSSFVLVSQLLKMKGSDASWRHNNEPPPEFLDYSDDEAEKLAKKKRKQKKNPKGKHNNKDKGDSPEPACQNNINRNRTVSVHPKQHQSIPRNFNQPPPRAYSPCPPNLITHPPNLSVPPPNLNARPLHYSSQPSNFNSQPSNFNSQPSNLNSQPSNFNSQPSNFNLRPPNFNPGPQSYGQRPPFLTYAQQLSAMEPSHSHRQPFFPQYYNQNSNMYPPRPTFPYHNSQIPPPGYGQQPLSQTNPNNPTYLIQQMRYPH